MKCPYLIEPHQIQGLEFISIFPVIQWLVKRSVNYQLNCMYGYESYNLIYIEFLG